MFGWTASASTFVLVRFPLHVVQHKQDSMENLPRSILLTLPKRSSVQSRSGHRVVFDIFVGAMSLERDAGEIA